MKKQLLISASVLALASASHAAVITWDETAADNAEIRNNTWTTGLGVTDGALVGADGVTVQHDPSSQAGSAFGAGKTITLGGYDFDGDGLADTVTMRYSFEAVGGVTYFGSSGHGVAGNGGKSINDNNEGFNFGISANSLTVVLSDSANFAVTNLSFDGFAGVQTSAKSGKTYDLGTEFGNNSLGDNQTGDTDFGLTTAFGLSHQAGSYRLADVGYQFSFDVKAHNGEFVRIDNVERLALSDTEAPYKATIPEARSFALTLGGLSLAFAWFFASRRKRR
jgi:hypothetical protein